MSFLAWLHDTQLSVTMRDSIWAEPIVETIHVLTLTVFLGFVLLIDLRLLGLALKGRRMSRLFEELNPGLFGGFAVMVVTGLLLFCGDPLSFFSTIFFKVKMIMIVLAGVNVLVFNATIGRTLARWDLALRPPLAARATGLVSLVLWVAIVAAGRAIAYALPPP